MFDLQLLAEASHITIKTDFNDSYNNPWHITRLMSADNGNISSYTFTTSRNNGLRIYINSDDGYSHTLTIPNICQSISFDDVYIDNMNDFLNEVLTYYNDNSRQFSFLQSTIETSSGSPVRIQHINKCHMIVSTSDKDKDNDTLNVFRTFRNSLRWTDGNVVD